MFRKRVLLYEILKFIYFITPFFVYVIALRPWFEVSGMLAFSRDDDRSEVNKKRPYGLFSQKNFFMLFKKIFLRLFTLLSSSSIMPFAYGFSNRR